MDSPTWTHTLQTLSRLRKHKRGGRADVLDQVGEALLIPRCPSSSSSSSSLQEGLGFPPSAAASQRLRVRADRGRVRDEARVHSHSAEMRMVVVVGGGPRWLRRLAPDQPLQCGSAVAPPSATGTAAVTSEEGAGLSAAPRPIATRRRREHVCGSPAGTRGGGGAMGGARGGTGESGSNLNDEFLRGFMLSID